MGERSLKAVDKILFINLERRPERLAEFRRRFPFFASPKVERFQAVDGRELSAEPEIVELFRGNDHGYRRAVVGCALSHLAIWRRAIAQAWSTTLVLEDDAHFHPRFEELWSEAAPHLPSDQELTYVGGKFSLDAEVPQESDVGPHFVRPTRQHFTTNAYLVSAAGAEKLVKLVERHGFHRAVDWFLIDHWHRLAVYSTRVPLCYSPEFYKSDIQLDTTTLI